MTRYYNSHPMTKAVSQGIGFFIRLFSAIVFVAWHFVKGDYFDSCGALMAKVQYGEMIADMRGKINGTVHSRNRAGAYMRNKVTPVNPNTTYQSAVRNRLTGISQGWRALTQIQRDAWNAAVSNFQRTNIFGQLRTPSGINLFSRLNINLLNIGQSALSTPPSPDIVEAFSSLSVAADDSANTVIITFAPAISAGFSAIVEATEPLSAGISFAKSQFRQIDVLTSADTSPANISTAYVNKFGSTPVEGTKIFVRVTQVNEVTGQAGIPLSASTITVA